MLPFLEMVSSPILPPSTHTTQHGCWRSQIQLMKVRESERKRERELEGPELINSVLVWSNVRFHHHVLGRGWFEAPPFLSMVFLPLHSAFLNPTQECFSPPTTGKRLTVIPMRRQRFSRPWTRLVKTSLQIHAMGSSRCFLPERKHSL